MHLYVGAFWSLGVVGGLFPQKTVIKLIDILVKIKIGISDDNQIVAHRTNS